MTEREWHLLEDRPVLESVQVDGVELRPGGRVRLRPRAGGDVMDLALAGRVATIRSIEQDYEGESHVSVIVDDDPGGDMGSVRQPGHRFFFRAQEVEPVSDDAAPLRTLVAGIGNLFMGDDAFGSEVARRLESEGIPAGARVTDFGIRGYDLAYALTSGYDIAILVDATSRGEAPGTLYLIEPDLSELDRQAMSGGPIAMDAHALDPVAILRLAKTFGELPRKILLLGCEPESLGGEAGRMGLSAPVSAAVEQAAARLRALLAEGFRD